MFLLLAQAAANEATKEVAEKAAETVAATTSQFGIWHSLMNSGPVVKLVLFILLIFSVLCWTLIIYKSIQLKKAQKESEGFWQKFSAGQIKDLSSAAGNANNPLYQIFHTGAQTLGKIKSSKASFSEMNRNILLQRIRQSREEESYKLEQYVSFLATTASVAPFIGLFGTVWGILTAFMAIGQEGTSSLATVGPYIAEALVATAVGLFAAIPAVIAYNYFVGKIRTINKMIDLFVDDFMLKSEQEMKA